MEEVAFPRSKTEPGRWLYMQKVKPYQKREVREPASYESSGHKMLTEQVTRT